VFLGEDLMSTRDYSDETARIIDEEVEVILRQCEQDCLDLLGEYRNSLDLVARALLEHETISGEEVRRLVRLGHQPPTPTDAPANGSGNGAGHADDATPPAPPTAPPPPSPAPGGHQAVRGDAGAQNWPYLDEGGT
jgi:cell division protease FtsH